MKEDFFKNKTESYRVKRFGVHKIIVHKISSDVNIGILRGAKKTNSLIICLIRR